MKEYPSLTTKHLILRGFTPNDAKDIQRLAGDKDIASATLSVPYPYEDGMAEQWISTHQGDLEKGLGPRFAIAVKQDVPYLIGAIGLHIDPEHQKAELGYWIGKPYWGQGYATEAAEAVLRYGFEQLELHRVYAYHFTRNPASGRVMQKIGMIHEGHLRENIKKWDIFEDEEVYGILKKDFGK